MPELSYWQKRAEARETAYREGSEDALASIKAAYSRAMRNISEETASVLRNLDARGGAESEDAAAYYARLERLAALKETISAEMSSVYKLELSKSKERYADVMREGFSRTMFDVQKGVKLAFSFDILPQKAIDKALKAEWFGSSFSRRIWKNTRKVGREASEIVTGGLMSGASVYAMRGQLMEAMKNELAELGDKGKFMAERLIRTETNYFANQGELAAYEEAGIEYYRFLATLDGRTSEICRELDDGVFPLAEAEPGVNCPPMHGFCRSTIVAVFDDDAMDGFARRARDAVTGETRAVPARLSYKDWYAENVSGKPEAEAAEKALRNAGYDKRQFEKYRLVFGGKIGKSLADFQRMKYNDSESWERFKASRADTLIKLDYQGSFDGMFSNIDVRRWYIHHDGQIPDMLDKSKPIEFQARQAHELRNTYRAQAREMMADQAARHELDKASPNLSFEALVADKMSKKKMTRDEAVLDIINTSQKTNDDVNRKLGLR